ncbi:MAG TPA: septum formation family protein [Candidatus Dormibacteraeota bacterium]|nr:septum formation family protein [Candidatus Dormibacteraeota bacterium]
MTDQIEPGEPGPPVDGEPSRDDALPVPAPPPPLKAGRWRPLIVLALLIAFVVVVVFTVKDNTAANDLKVGDCFDLPTATAVQTVTHHACTEPHTAEVFLVADYTGTAMDTPLTLLLEAFVGATCDPAFTAYVGRDLAASPDLSIGYFYPDVDAWQQGKRTITCYVAKTDQSAISASLKGSAAQ